MKFKDYSKISDSLNDLKYSITEDENQTTVNIKKDSSTIAFYFYKDDDKTIYISNLHVPKKERKQGTGKYLLHLCESIGKKLKFTKSCLLVEKDSWVKTWYESEGYEELKPKDSNHVWMMKEL